MKEIERMIRAGFFERKSYRDQEDYFRTTAQVLLERGYVKESFQEAIAERERSFPTGLHALGGMVSIPHAESCHVIKEAIIVTAFTEPVDFISMEDMETVLPVEMSFMLLVPEAGRHIDCLQQLIEVINHPEFSKLKEAGSMDEYLTLLHGMDRLEQEG